MEILMVSLGAVALVFMSRDAIGALVLGWRRDRDERKVARLETLLQESDAEIRLLAADRDAASAALRTALGERDEARSSRDLASQAVRTALAERDAARRERDAHRAEAARLLQNVGVSQVTRQTTELSLEGWARATFGPPAAGVQVHLYATFMGISGLGAAPARWVLGKSSYTSTEPPPFTGDGRRAAPFELSW